MTASAVEEVDFSAMYVCFASSVKIAYANICKDDCIISSAKITGCK